jgi:soluble lytic murein transglycosylase
VKSFVRKASLAGACLILVGVANAQVSPQAGSASVPVQTPPLGYTPSPSADDMTTLREALRAATQGDVSRAESLRGSLSDPVARKLVLWAMADSAGSSMSFFELDQARRDLWGWPRASRRQAAAEKQLEAQAMPPAQVIAWFKGDDPQTAEGAMALAAAYRASGRADDAKALIKKFWTTQPFDAEPQRQMLARFGDLLTPEDHVRRADMLLYGQQGPAARDMIALLPADQQTLARARMSFRQGDANAASLLQGLPASLQDDPGVAFERARSLTRQRDGVLALAYVGRLTKSPPSDEASSALWSVRKSLVNAALSTRNYQAAYQAAADNGMSSGVDYTEAEFYAGWIALTKLHDAALADKHFAHIQAVGASPITQARALYWRGRAAEASGDAIGAQDLYSQGGQFITTFYGQLAAQKAGNRTLELGQDPVPTAADRARFEGRETLRAARLLAQIGSRDLLRPFVLNIAETLPTAEEYVLLVDFAKSYGEQDLSMRVVRAAAQHGYILPERGYPILASTRIEGGAEPAFSLAIARQESNFDPGARSNVGARGMMQLMPSTAAILARRMGVGYSAERLYDADYNIRLGSTYLQKMIDDMGGSYVMAAASYNAGPNHMPDWTSICGDPRTASGDPIDFIECIPFSETRNYAMRAMETMEVYRARLNGGHTPLTLAQDLKRGSYTPVPTSFVAGGAFPANEPKPAQPTALAESDAPATATR